MLKAAFVKGQAKTIFSCNRLWRLKHTNEGYCNLLGLQQTTNNCFHQTENYLATKQLPLPLNIKELTSSEKLKFSPERSRDINGSFISSSSSSSKLSFVDLQSDNRIPVDARIECYDCSGTVNLNSAMQTNVPFPFVSRVKPIHLNMPGGQWRQKQKYVSEDLNNVHHVNSRNGTSVSLGSGCGTKNFYFFLPIQDLNSSGVLFPFSRLNSTQFRTFCTVKEKSETNQGNTGSKKLTTRRKFKNLIKKYGPIALGLYISISLTSLLIIYLVVASGIDTSAFTKTFGGSEGAADTATQFIIAFAIHKMLAPVRIGITLVATPVVAKRLMQLGIWKPKIK